MHYSGSVWEEGCTSRKTIECRSEAMILSNDHTPPKTRFRKSFNGVQEARLFLQYKKTETARSELWWAHAEQLLLCQVVTACHRPGDENLQTLRLGQPGGPSNYSTDGHCPGSWILTHFMFPFLSFAHTVRSNRTVTNALGEANIKHQKTTAHISP